MGQRSIWFINQEDGKEYRISFRIKKSFFGTWCLGEKPVLSDFSIYRPDQPESILPIKVIAYDNTSKAANFIHQLILRLEKLKLILLNRTPLR